MTANLTTATSTANHSHGGAIDYKEMERILRKPLRDQSSTNPSASAKDVFASKRKDSVSESAPVPAGAGASKGASKR